VPVVVALYLTLPLVLFGLQLVVLVVGTYEFCRAYKLAFPVWMPLKIVVTFLPYQVMLMVAAFRAMGRLLVGKRAWEKTVHLGAHRQAWRWSYAA